MKVNILKMTLVDFKGTREKTVAFNGNTAISGENGAGKSTFFDAYLWLFTDKDSNLVSNPNIRPNDGRECIPTVTIDMDVDGKPVQAVKMQKMKTSPDGKIALSNSYEINSVPKTERDFKAYLTELGFDFTNFLSLANVDVFLNGLSDKKQRENIRNLLFTMANKDLTDLQVARSMGEEVEDLRIALDTHNLEEITCMQRAEEKRIKDLYGKDGEIIDAEIRGKEGLREDHDYSALELKKNFLRDQIKENEKQLISIDRENHKYEKTTQDIMEQKFKLSDIKREAHEKFLAKHSERTNALNDLDNKITQTKKNIEYAKYSLKQSESQLNEYSTALQRKRNEYISAKVEEFKDDSIICPTCKQQLPVEEAEKIRTRFETDKENRLKRITSEGNAAKKRVEDTKEAISNYTSKIADLENLLTQLNTQKDEILSTDAPMEPDVTLTARYKAVESKIAEMEASLASETSGETKKREILQENEELNAQIADIERQLAGAVNNERIDQQIEGLKNKKRQLEQQKANCEKMMYQIDLLNRRKNELLSESINKNFEMVNFRLFKYLKNGSYEQDCTPMSKDGKVIGEATNTALTLMMKLDIVKGLQRFFNQYYPVFIDGAECLDTANWSSLKADTQLVALKVTDDSELIVEGV